ncbi:hypothetical protein KIPB_010046 [Kipferlia bialata]|uniref:Carboxypeptidase regulatory-like domain-containing protein n=1 Tax=Kipferlia bialata TaxID=797122 RepID=A0A391NYD5_9EUKA|nr:hypothetical protein KIPB_010046 [Kipferlia bialata]|eukprot:g10046.t1
MLFLFVCLALLVTALAQETDQCGCIVVDGCGVYCLQDICPDRTLIGTVTDMETGLPVEDVFLGILGGSETVFTDENGKYILDTSWVSFGDTLLEVAPPSPVYTPAIFGYNIVIKQCGVTVQDGTYRLPLHITAGLYPVVFTPPAPYESQEHVASLPTCGSTTLNVQLESG